MDHTFEQTTLSVLILLSEKSFYRSCDMADKLSISCDAIRQHIQRLKEFGYGITLAADKGYQLTHPTIPLLPPNISAYLTALGFKEPCHIEVCPKVASTNDRLKPLKQEPNQITLCLAEQQVSGRGRFNRYWHSPFGENIYLSIKSTLAVPFAKMSGFSLVISLALIEGLVVYGFPKDLFSIKWPNDLLLDGKKLAGILVELSGEVDSGVETIIGIGLNVAMQQASIEKEWTSLGHYFDKRIDRNKLSAHVINSVCEKITQFKRLGFDAFRHDWKKYDALQNTFIELSFCNNKINGWCQGIDELGNILIKRQNNIVESYSAGEVSFHKKQS